MFEFFFFTTIQLSRYGLISWMFENATMTRFLLSLEGRWNENMVKYMLSCLGILGVLGRVCILKQYNRRYCLHSGQSAVSCPAPWPDNNWYTLRIYSNPCNLELLWRYFGPVFTISKYYVAQMWSFSFPPQRSSSIWNGQSSHDSVLARLWKS